MIYDLVVIGAGAGGCFAAIRLGELKKGARILVLEAGRKPLSKVEISGGGRCNVTHACFDPEELIKYYPRGNPELLAPFYKFQPQDMVEWFQQKGVPIKKEADGRMFPKTDSSLTIVNCFLNACRKLNIEIRTSTRVVSWERNGIWRITLMNGEEILTNNLLISSGSDQRTWDYLKKMGLTIVEPVPSLFTFNIQDKLLTALQGISVPKVISNISEAAGRGTGIDDNNTANDGGVTGPILITHWGVSGPAVLKLSAWYARELYKCGYTFDFEINWSAQSKDKVVLAINNICQKQTKKSVQNLSLFEIPARLWKYLCNKAGISETTNCSEIGKAKIDSLANVLTKDIYRVIGKSTYKDEFVTSGGVDLSEINLERFESKKLSSLFLVGEVLNIDALTGGFNFQSAWTGAEIVARALSR